MFILTNTHILKLFTGTLSASLPGHWCPGSMVDGLNWCSSGSGAHGHFICIWGSFRLLLPNVSFLINCPVSCFPWRFVAVELLELTRFASTGHRD